MIVAQSVGAVEYTHYHLTVSKDKIAILETI